MPAVQIQRLLDKFRRRGDIFLVQQSQDLSRIRPRVFMKQTTNCPPRDTLRVCRMAWPTCVRLRIDLPAAFNDLCDDSICDFHEAQIRLLRPQTMNHLDESRLTTLRAHHAPVFVLQGGNASLAAATTEPQIGWRGTRPMPSYHACQQVRNYGNSRGMHAVFDSFVGAQMLHPGGGQIDENPVSPNAVAVQVR